MPRRSPPTVCHLQWNVAQALRRYPQYQNILWRDVPTGSSIYNALEVVLEQRFAHGVQFRAGYTYSRLNNDGAESAQGGNGVNATIQNPACPHVCEWGLSQDDTPHVFLFGYSWELPREAISKVRRGCC